MSPGRFLVNFRMIPRYSLWLLVDKWSEIHRGCDVSIRQKQETKNAYRINLL